MQAFILLMLLFAAHPAWAAISCGDAIEFNDLTPTDPETIAYTTPAGSNQVLFVGVSMRHTSFTIDGATQAGNAMTAVAAQSFLSPVATRLFYIVAPTSGTNNVVVDYSSIPLADAIVIWTCSGVDQTTPIRAFQSATGTGTAASVTVAGVQSGDVVVDIVGADVQTTDPTVGANQTAFHLGNDGSEFGWGASQQAGADGGVMSWTMGASQEWSTQAAALIPAAGATARRRVAPMVLP